MTSVNLRPIHDLIVQHPFASVLTVAVCILACLPVFFYILAKVIALVKFFKGKR